MKKVVLLFLLPLLLAGCIQFGQKPVENPSGTTGAPTVVATATPAERIECGSNESCLLKATETCAKAIYSLEQTEGGIRAISVGEVRGFNPEGKCELYSKVSINGKVQEMTCFAPKELLAKWNDVLQIEAERKKYCGGGSGPIAAKASETSEATEVETTNQKGIVEVAMILKPSGSENAAIAGVIKSGVISVGDKGTLNGKQFEVKKIECHFQELNEATTQTKGGCAFFLDGLTKADGKEGDLFVIPQLQRA